MNAGSRLRQAREQLGLTYREVEQASFELASQRGQADFIVRISRLADIENNGVVPTLHKLYSLATIYHLDPLEVSGWFGVPMAKHFRDGANLSAPRTHLVAPPASLLLPLRFDPGFDPRRTEYLSRMVERWAELEGTMLHGPERYRYGYIGTDDRWMGPLLPPGSLVLIDPSRQEVRNTSWKNEFERPIYFVDVREGYRCGWCLRQDRSLILQPHTLSPCAPEVRTYPEEAEIVGQVVGAVMRLCET